jgi:hypothetical protein
MFDISRLGQGPRPDLLQKDLEERLAREKKEEEEAELAKKDPVAAKKRAESKPEPKDAMAMMLAMVELLLPWVCVAVGVYFLAVFLISKF